MISDQLSAEDIIVDSQTSFNNAHDVASSSDRIVWRTGTYSNIFMDIDNDNLTIIAEVSGEVIFTGSSKMEINGDNVTVSGFQYLNGNIGDDNVVDIRGSNILYTQMNIDAYTCYKYLRVREESQYVVISYSNFENRLNLIDQNILSILVDNNQPGYHKVQYCSFKNFDGTGNDQGIEPIRIGVSTQAEFNSRSLVEYCYFTQCNGDGEIISSKASQNVYRYNTFEDNPLSELVLRHGSENIVYGNFFINGRSGVRVREGQDHYIYNNYFHNLDDRPIFLQNEDSDPLDNINIAFNTIVDCDEVRLGGDGGSDPPTNVTFVNNIFADPKDDLFRNETGNETWIGNITSGGLGMPRPSSGLVSANPRLIANEEGYFGLESNSPAIDAAESGFAELPQFAGMDPIDTDISLDLMGQDRPSSISSKDIGCNEFPHNVLIQPIVSEDNTGPDYNNSTSINGYGNATIVDDLIQLTPNPVSDQLSIRIVTESNAPLLMKVVDGKGSVMEVIEIETPYQDQSINRGVENWANGLYSIQVQRIDPSSGVLQIQSIKFIKL